MRKTLAYMRAQKSTGNKIVMLTAYDYPTARLEDEVGVDAVLVGDSVGTNVLGYESEKQVSMEDIIHHLKAVRRGVKAAYLLADLPYRSYETAAQALENARLLLSHGADGVKLEGALPEIVGHLRASDIEVCAHLGYTPQSHDKAGLRAKTGVEAVQLIEEARLLERAGAGWLVLELVPEEVARKATESLAIPTVGIGAGRFTDGQVLIVLDMLGVNAFDLRHNKKYERFHDRGLDAVRSYAQEVRARRFPAAENSRHLAEAELREFVSLLQERGLQRNGHG